MEGNPNEIAFVENHLHELVGEEKYLSRWLLQIQTGLKASLIQEVKKTEMEDDSDVNDCEKLASEVEKALSVAKSAMESLSGKNIKKGTSPIAKRHDNQFNASTHPKKSTDSPKVNQEGFYRSTMATRPPSVPRYRPAYTTAPYQTFRERPKSARRSVGNSALIFKSKALCKGNVEKPARATNNNQNSSAPPNCTQPAPSSVPTLPDIQYGPKNFSQQATCETVKFHLDANIKERVDQVRLLSENMEKIAYLLKVDQESISKRKLLERIERLGDDGTEEPEVRLIRLCVALALPKVGILFEEFLKVCDSIDWEIATEKQRSWQQKMIASFRGLFSSVWQLRPILLADQSSADSNVGNHESRNPLGQNVPFASSESEPTLDTIWRAYVCAGEDIDSLIPRSSLSRGQLLSTGPTVFQSASPGDLEDLLDLWQDIIHAQRELKMLTFFEERLPHWLHQLSQQDSNQASTFRAICGLVLGCPPIALAND